MRDERLVGMALGDLRWFGLLYERYADRLYWYASVRTGSAAAADDVVGETMVTVIEQLHRFDARRGSFASWLFAIAHRKIVDQHRYHQRLRRFLTRSGHRLELAEEEDALERVLRHERSGQLHAALRELPAADQDVIALRFSAELSSAEIAGVLGVTPVAARKRLSRALERLEARLREEGPQA
jgi:RNA polymerase sigma-70 factor (ECF subfamily)